MIVRAVGQIDIRRTAGQAAAHTPYGWRTAGTHSVFQPVWLSPQKFWQNSLGIPLIIKVRIGRDIRIHRYLEHMLLLLKRLQIVPLLPGKRKTIRIIASLPRSAQTRPAASPVNSNRAVSVPSPLHQAAGYCLLHNNIERPLRKLLQNPCIVSPVQAAGQGGINQLAVLQGLLKCLQAIKIHQLIRNPLSAANRPYYHCHCCPGSCQVLN